MTSPRGTSRRSPAPVRPAACRPLLLIAGLAAAAGPALAADLTPSAVFDPTPTAPASGFSLTASATLATDRFDRGLTRTEHAPYGEARLVGATDLAYGEVAVVSAGDDPDVGLAGRVGLTPKLEGMAFDLSVGRVWTPDYAPDDAWSAAATMAVPLADTVTARTGLYKEWLRDGDDTFGVFAGGSVRTSVGAVASLDGIYEREGGDSLTAAAGVSVPVAETVSVSGTLAWREEYGDKASYGYWDAGITWTPAAWAAVDVRYHGTSLDTAACATQSAETCDDRLMGSLTLKTDVLSAASGWTK